MAAPASIVFVVDDDVSVREAMDLLFQAAGWYAELFATAAEFLARPRPTVPCCLVLDVTLPGLSGLDLQKRLTERTEMPIIFMTGHGDVPMSVQAMKAGAAEFLTKPFKDDVLLDAIRDAIAKSRAALTHVAEAQALEHCYESLTPRERDVLELLAHGLTNRQIGERLGISEHTAKFHVAAVSQKLGAASRTDAVTRGVRRGLVTL